MAERVRVRILERRIFKADRVRLNKNKKIK